MSIHERNRGLTMVELGTHFLAIGDSLPRHWGLTLSPLGTYWSCDPMKMRVNNYAEKDENNLHIICIYAENCVYLHRNSRETRRVGEMDSDGDFVE